jgi:hypothetical protein
LEKISCILIYERSMTEKDYSFGFRIKNEKEIIHSRMLPVL